MSGSLWTVLERENCRRPARRSGRVRCALSCGIARGARCPGCWRCRKSRTGRCLYRFSLFFQANDILVGNFPSKVPLRPALLEALLEKNRSPRIGHKRTRRGQEDVSSAVLDLNPAPKKGRIAGHIAISF